MARYAIDRFEGEDWAVLEDERAQATLPPHEIPRLAKLARLRIPPKSAPRAKVAGGTVAGEKPVTPSHVRGPEPDILEPAPKPRPAPGADPPEILKRRQDDDAVRTVIRDAVFDAV